MPARPARALTVVAAALLLVLTACTGAGSRAQAESPATPTAALVTPVFSARRAPDVLRASVAGEALRATLEPVLERAPADSCVVVSTGGQVVLRRDGDRPMVPASTAKLLTGAAVLHRFAPDDRLSTVAGAAAAPRDGVVDGDLYLVGGGDPLLTTAGYTVTFENPAQLANDFTQLADRIAGAGVREIRGRVVGDDSRYDTVRWVPSWPARYQREGYVGPLSALTVNDGSTGFTETPDQASGSRRPGDPPLLAAETLVTLLEARGVRVDGGAGTGSAPGGLVEVARLESLPMADLVGELIADSDNTTAELLVKELGLQASGAGSTEAGLRALTAELEAQGLDTTGLDLLDGSGLDPANRLTCDLLVAALDRAGPDSVLARNLPVAGETGTLRRRMRGTPAQGVVRAKTGTLAEVNALAGFVSMPSGASVTFAYLINGPDQPLGLAPLDEFAVALAAAPEGPTIDQLAPLAPAG